MTDKNKWINWAVPLLLVLSALSILIFYPASDPAKPSISNTKPVIQNSDYELKDIRETANSLVSTFFNGSDEDKTEQISALESTLTHLKNEKPGTTNDAFQALKDNNINKAIVTLVTLAGQQENIREAAKTWINIGNIQNLTSTEQALRAYQKASGLDPDNSNAWNRQGHLYRQLKQLDKAETAYKKVQQLTTQSTTNQAISLANFGLLNQSKGDYPAAEKAFLKSLEIYTNIKNDAGIASTSENLASLYKQSKQLGKSEQYYLKALQTYQKNEQPQHIATINTALGSLYQSLKQTEKAQQHYQEALKISLENNLQGDMASIYSNLGIIAQQNNQLDKSKEYFDKSLEINQQIKRTIGTADQYGNLAILNRKKRNYTIAEDFHNKAIEVYKQNKHKNGVISQQINLGFLYKVWNKPEKACGVWKQTLKELNLEKNTRADRVEKLIQDTCGDTI